MDEAEQYLKFEIKTDGYAYFKTMVDLDVILCDVNRKELQNISLKANQEFETEMTKGTYYIKTFGIKENYTGLKFLFNERKREEEKKDILEIPSKTDHYITYIPKEEGYITVTNLSNCADGKVPLALYDRNKKRISAITNTSTSSATDKAIYGVSKDTKYYIHVQSKLEQILLGYKFQKISENSGDNKEKAVDIPNGTKVEGTLTAGIKDVDWYKINIEKRKEITISVNSTINGEIQVALYTSNGKQLATINLNENCKKIQLKSKDTLREGTYFLKLNATDSFSTGYYKIEWE